MLQPFMTLTNFISTMWQGETEFSGNKYKNHMTRHIKKCFFIFYYQARR